MWARHGSMDGTGVAVGNGRTVFRRAGTGPSHERGMTNASVATGDRRSVLVVEDDRGIAQGLRALLVSRGFAVDVETEPQAALQRASEHGYHVVVADFDLGDQDGLDLVRRLRDLCPRLPILAVTAIDRSEALRASEDLDLQGCFEKPVDPEQLMEAVARSASSER